MSVTSTTEASAVRLHKTVWKKNPVSGHEWPEIKFISRWSVQGGKSVGRPTFFSERAAREHAAWLNSL